jgi:archaetidylinositol phosphate synthase
MSDIEKHKRVHDMLLGPLERPALQWLSTRMPAWINPDILTLIGVVGSIMIFTGYALTNSASGYLWLASAGFVVNWFGDSLDGTLARFRKIERPRYGFFVDHTVDSFSMVLIFVGLGISAYVRLEIALVACIGYLLMSILAYVGAFVSGEFKISYAKIGPTELRVLVILVNTWIYFSGNQVLTVGGVSITVFDLILSVIGLLLMAFFTVNTTVQALHWRSVDR